LRPGLGFGFITGVGAVTGVVTALLVVLAYRFVPGYRRSMAEVMRLMGSFSPPVLFVMAIPSAFGEELLFRGSLQMLLGPLVAAALFGLAHTSGQRRFWSYGVTAGVIGYLFGLAYQFTGELWAPILAHTVYNAAVLVTLSGRFTGVDGGQGIWYNTFCR
jgi:membrane protease YdiL (CAAX protease family)